MFYITFPPQIVIYLTSGPRFTRVLIWPTHTKKAQFTQERVEYNVFLFDDPLKGPKSLKIFKINLTFRFDKLSHLSKSVHKGENSQILTVSNKKLCFSFVFSLRVLVKVNQDLYPFPSL
jgi:hypothetical protein